MRMRTIRVNYLLTIDYNMPKQIVKNTTRESSKLTNNNGSKKNLVTITSESINTPEKSRLSSPPYCKVCHLARCSCKKE
jgi:hypothetical protein